MELKDCPFCGGEAIITTEEDFAELVEMHGSACLLIQCSNPLCGCHKYFHYHEMDYPLMAELAILSWNRRLADEVQESESL